MKFTIQWEHRAIMNTEQRNYSKPKNFYELLSYEFHFYIMIHLPFRGRIILKLIPSTTLLCCRVLLNGHLASSIIARTHYHKAFHVAIVSYPILASNANVARHLSRDAGKWLCSSQLKACSVCWWFNRILGTTHPYDPSAVYLLSILTFPRQHKALDSLLPSCNICVYA